MSLKYKILLFVMSIFIVFTVFNLLNLKNNFSESIFAEKKSYLESQIDIAIGIIDVYLQEERQGKISRAEAQKLSMNILNTLRMGPDNNDYFLIYDLDGNNVMHPLLPERIGKNFIDLKDKNGFEYIKEMIEISKNKGEGFIQYMGPSKKVKGKFDPKLTYIRAVSDWRWIVGTGVYVNDVNETIQARIWELAVVAIIVLIVAAFCLFIFVEFQISRPLNDLKNAALELSEGRFKTVTVKGRDEMSQVAAAMNKTQGLIDRITHMMTNLVGLVQNLGASSKDLSEVSNSMVGELGTAAQKTDTVATAAEEMSASGSSVADSMEEINSALNNVASATDEMTTTIVGIASSTEQARNIVSEAVTHGELSSDRMTELDHAAKEIGKVTETITTISAQTNLLALNATIEAARAGSAGKGFAVVANEIKELAQQTSVATEDIKARINGIQNTSRMTIEDIQKITRIVKQVSDIVNSISAAIEEQSVTTKEIAKNISETASGVNNSTKLVSEISQVTKRVAQDIGVLSGNINDINEGSQTVKASAVMLEEMAVQLEKVMSDFKR